MDKFNWKTVMKYRNFLFGLSAVWIVFFHIRDMVKIPKFNFFSGVLFLGSMGVDIFLFLSAVGLSYSIEKNSLKDFYKNRFLRLWVPFLIICVPYYMWRDSVTGITPERIQCFFLDITAVNFWLKPKVPFWYVSLATAMYLVYPLLYKLYKKNKYLIPVIGVVCVLTEIVLMHNSVFEHAEKGISRIPIILIGIWFSDIVKENREIPKKHILYCALTVAACVCLYALVALRVHIMYKRFIYAIMTVPLIVVIAYVMERFSTWRIRNIVHSFFCFFGTMSLELYLVHNAITRILKYYDLTTYPAYTYYLWIFPVSVVLAFMYNRIAESIVKKIDQRKGK